MLGVASEYVEIARSAIEARNRQRTLAVLPCNWHALMVFCDMSTQWRVVPGLAKLHMQGLDYAALPLVMAACKPTIAPEHRKPLPELMAQLRVLERTAAALLNAK